METIYNWKVLDSKTFKTKEEFTTRTLDRNIASQKMVNEGILQYAGYIETES